ncbi:MAG TPA: rRNA maturation RNase YbeY [Candidatus Cloacimonadota bacterium]|nr:rRNA maturation RNase YbeY [Candidatus Cloacimonadota bacterium]
MTSIDIEGDLPCGTDASAIKGMAEIICAAEAPDTDFQISLQLVTSETMKEYNRLYRGVDHNTDVLSFAGDVMVLDGRKTRLCDIIIDTNQVFIQKGTNTFREEFWLVLIHGFLHLTGYDHIRTADRRKMEDAEENYRKQIPEGGIG